MESNIKTDNIAFELEEAQLSDLPAIVEVLTLAFEKDAEWQYLCRNVKPEGVQKFWIDTFTRNLTNKGFVYFVIKEAVTGKIVAWSGLTRPHKMSADEIAASKQEIVLPAGLPEEPFNAFLESIDTARKYGYDPAKHFHRRITMVHPDFQKLRLGTRLTKHCNGLADQEGARTYSVARNTSRPMLENFNFKLLGREGQDLTKYGGGKDDAILWMFMREPQSS